MQLSKSNLISSSVSAYLELTKENMWNWRDEVTGEWRKLHSEELHNLYSSPNIVRQIKSRKMRWAGHVARMGEERKVYKVLVGKPERKRPHGRLRRRWEDEIIMNLREIGWGGVSGFSWLRIRAGVGLCEYGDEPSGSGATFS
jgi:hypothetical protein